MAKGFSEFLDVASKVTDIKKTETILPVARKTGIVTPLVTGDDLTLRTSVTSPINYDKDLSKLLHKHSLFLVDGEHIKPNYDEFCKETSNIDKMSLLWALYKSSYDILDSSREIACENTEKECDEKFNVPISLDDLIHDDTFTVWEETEKNSEEGEEGKEEKFVPFYDYRFPIGSVFNTGEDEVFYEFLTMIPSIKDNNKMLGLISNDILQYNLENIGSIFSKTEQIGLVTDAMRISSKKGNFNAVETNNKNEILLALKEWVPNTISDDVLNKYSKRFGMYTPNFYKEVACPSCGYNFKLHIDLELEFFRRSLLSGGESE